LLLIRKVDVLTRVLKGQPAEAGVAAGLYRVRRPPATGTARLSAREQELITLAAQGRTDAQIAARLHISISTVRSHLDRVRDKTGCRRAGLSRLALTEGLI
jgi:DNA-binding CsgD family transcriptional regulator